MNPQDQEPLPTKFLEASWEDLHGVLRESGYLTNNQACALAYEIQRKFATQEPLPDQNAPTEVFLQLYGDSSADGGPVDYTNEVSWCWHRVNESDVRYVQAATQEQQRAEPTMEQMKSLMRTLRHEDRTGSDLWGQSTPGEKTVAFKVLRAFCATRKDVSPPPEPADGYAESQGLPPRVWLNDTGTSLKLSFEPIKGAAEHFEYRPAAPPSAPASEPGEEDWRLPAPVKCGHMTFGKGVKISALVARMNRLYAEAYPDCVGLTQAANCAT